MDDFDRCYRAVQSRDARFDGWFFTAVTSTGIYCRPSCPAMTPKPQNVRFYPTAAAAQQGGFRACLRCRPDATPGSPEWSGRADVAARAVKLVLDGEVDRSGVSGLSRRLGYSERQLHRVLVAEVGTGALALARAQRAQTARLLLETTSLAATEVAFGAGFSSIRQFNDTVKQVFGRTPTELRHGARRGTRLPAAAPAGATPRLTVRLAHRQPFAADALVAFLGARALPGVEEYDGRRLRRSLRLPHAAAVVSLVPMAGYVEATLSLGDLRDLTAAIARCRHLCNLDADPLAVDRALGADRALARVVRDTPGLRVPGSVDGFETAVRAVVGQQVSVAGARTIAATLVSEAGDLLAADVAGADPVDGADGARGGVARLFPTAAALADLAASRPAAFAMPARRRLALQALAQSVEAGKITLDPACDPDELGGELQALPGIGPWTSSYVVMRAVGHPDALLPGDLGSRRGARRLGLPDDPAALAAHAERWRPWRSYGQMHLWNATST